MLKRFILWDYPRASWQYDVMVGVILAFLSGLIAFAWLPSYPIWGVIFITVSVFVIWALTVHGSDIAYD